VTVPPPRKVLIIKPSSLGDVVTALPVLRGLARTFPDAEVAWLVVPGCAGILAGQTGLDEIILFDRQRFGRMAYSPSASWAFAALCRDLRRRRFDWVIDLQGLFRSGFVARATGAPVRAGFAGAREFASAFYTHPVDVQAEHTIDRNIELARALGVDAGPDDLVLDVTPDARRGADSGLRAAGIEPGTYWLVVPGTRWPNKLYPRRHWRQVVAGLARHGPVVVAGTPDERDLCEAAIGGADGRVANLAGRTSPGELAAVVASARAAVCCDSATNLIAPAVGTPFVTLLGPTRPERTGPYAGRGTALAADIPCIGCLKRRCRHVSCMQLIEPERVVRAAIQAAGRGGRGDAPRR